jgi:hypothetical protein
VHPGWTLTLIKGKVRIFLIFFLQKLHAENFFLLNIQLLSTSFQMADKGDAGICSNHILPVRMFLSTQSMPARVRGAGT